MDTLSCSIRGLREEMGWSQKELGEKVGESQQSISRMELGITKTIYPQTIRNLASVFEVGVNVLLYSISSDIP